MYIHVYHLWYITSNSFHSDIYMYPQSNWKQVAFNGTVKMHLEKSCVYTWGVGCSISNSCALVYFAGLWFWSQEASPGLWHSEYGHFIQGMCTCMCYEAQSLLFVRQTGKYLVKREAGLGHSQTLESQKQLDYSLVKPALQKWAGSQQTTPRDSSSHSYPRS